MPVKQCLISLKRILNLPMTGSQNLLKRKKPPSVNLKLSYHRDHGPGKK